MLENGLRSFEKYAFEPNSDNYKGANTSVKIIDKEASGEGFFDLHNAYVEISGAILKANGTRYTNAEFEAAAQNIAFANHGPFHMFNNSELWLNDYKVEEIRDPGTVVSMLSPLLQDEDWINSRARSSSSVEEDGTPGSAVGKGFTIRPEQIYDDKVVGSSLNGTFQFSMLLSMIFGFCDTYDKAIPGARIKLRLTRGDNYDSRSLYSQGDGIPSKISIDGLRLIIPVAKLDSRYTADYQEGLAQGLPIVINYLKRRLVESEITTGSTQAQIKVGAAETGTEPRFIVTSFQQNNINNRNVSPNSYLKCDVSNYRCRVNNQMFPERYDTVNFTET